MTASRKKVQIAAHMGVHGSNIPGNTLAGSRFDDLALWDDPDKVWGWMAQKGYDIIQTDWTLALFQYLRPRGY